MVGLVANGSATSMSLPTPGFEGFEKRLEVEFFPRPFSTCLGLRALGRDELDRITHAAECTIVSQLSNSVFDSYVLSESSLFVYPTRLVMKTCGTTQLLNAVPVILALANNLGLRPSRCKYTRGTFLFPEAQPNVYQSFSREVAVLEASFGHLGSGGKAYVLGDMLQFPNWHIYVADAEDLTAPVDPTYTLEVCMTELDRSVAKQFYQEEEDGPKVASAVTKSSGIADLLPGSSINDFLFEPCGYSMNGIEGSAHSTVHITPEDGFSYASWETQGYGPKDVDLGHLLKKVVKTFKPGRFSVAVYVDGPIVGKENSWSAALPVPEGFSCIGSQRQNLPYGASVVFHTFEVASSAIVGMSPAPLYAGMVVEDVPLKARVGVPEIFGVHPVLETRMLHGKEAAEVIASVDPVLIGPSPQDTDRFIQQIVAKEKIESSFYVVDLAVVSQLYRLWCVSLPRVTPFYAVKCNPDPVLLSFLCSLGAGFDVASKAELTAVMDVGCSSHRIIFASPVKLESHVKEAANRGVELTTFDSEAELVKLRALYPGVKAVLRIRADDRTARCPLGVKYGAEEDEWAGLLRTARDLGVSVVGVSFHVGSGASSATAFVDAIEAARSVFDCAVNMSMEPMTLLDIGGGFTSPGGAGLDFRTAASAISEALDKYFPVEMGVNIIAEPGRYFAEAPATLATNVFGSRFRSKGAAKLAEYWVNDGIYGSMNCLLYDHASLKVRPVAVTSEGKTCVGGQWSGQMYLTTIFGPTCDGLDTLMRDTWLPHLAFGDRLVFPRMGAYTMAAGSGFNGFNISDIKTYYVYSSDNAPVDVWKGDIIDCEFPSDCNGAGESEEDGAGESEEVLDSGSDGELEL